jgi:hypothetical protein
VPLRTRAERKQRIERYLEISVIVAALATMPLTYAHMQEWDGPVLFALDWVVWSVFLIEFSFLMAISTNRKRTMRQQWFNLGIVVVSFPLLPHLLGLTRLMRLFRPLRMVAGFRIARPVQLLRLYAMRSAGSRRAMGKLKESGHADEVRERAKAVGKDLAPGGDSEDGEGAR